MKWLLSLAILFGSFAAQAEVLLGAGAGVAFENLNDGRSIQARQALFLKGGYRLTPVDLFVEYNTFNATDGTQMLMIKRTHHETIVWARHVLDHKWNVSPTFGVGTGLIYESVHTQFGDGSTEDSGSPDLMLAGSAGVRAQFNRYFAALLDARLAFSSAYSTNPAVSALGALEFYF